MNYKEKTKKIVENISKALNIKNNFEHLEIYVAHITKQNKLMNLTAFKNDVLWEKGIYESISMMYQIFQESNFENKKVLDIGAGTGFPTVPFKIIYPKFLLTIHESHNKKVKFLQTINTELNLGINILNIRTEESTNNEYFDIITARAVGSTRILSEISSKILKINGFCFFLKGPALSQELEDARYIMHQVNYSYKILKNNDKNIESSLVLLKLTKTGKTPKKYPRDWAIIKNNK